MLLNALQEAVIKCPLILLLFTYKVSLSKVVPHCTQTSLLLVSFNPIYASLNAHNKLLGD